jgi:hypothetical protein
MKSVQIAQIVSTSNGLYGVGQNGVVYVYCGAEYGWKALNMDLMTEAAQRRKRKEMDERG